MDKVYIRDLSMECIIGTDPDERECKQEVIINVVIGCDLAAAGASDDLSDTVNYKALKQQIVSLVEGSRFFLIEKLAARISGLCLSVDGTRNVTVTVDKPGALSRARSVAVEIYREK